MNSLFESFTQSEIDNYIPNNHKYEKYLRDYDYYDYNDDIITIPNNYRYDY